MQKLAQTVATNYPPVYLREGEVSGPLLHPRSCVPLILLCWHGKVLRGGAAPGQSAVALPVARVSRFRGGRLDGGEGWRGGHSAEQGRGFVLV